MAAGDFETQVIERAREMLRAARLGLDDFETGSEVRESHGAYSIAVFGRSVTFILQNLRSTQRPAFDEWYGPKTEEMRKDDLMAYFTSLRNEILKEGAPEMVTTIVYLSGDPLSDTTLGPKVTGREFDGDRPCLHLGQPIDEMTLAGCAHLYLGYLRQLIDEAEELFAPPQR